MHFALCGTGIALPVESYVGLDPPWRRRSFDNALLYTAHISIYVYIYFLIIHSPMFLGLKYKYDSSYFLGPIF